MAVAAGQRGLTTRPAWFAARRDGASSALDGTKEMMHPCLIYLHGISLVAHRLHRQDEIVVAGRVRVAAGLRGLAGGGGWLDPDVGDHLGGNGRAADGAAAENRAEGEPPQVEESTSSCGRARAHLAELPAGVRAGEGRARPGVGRDGR